MKRRIFCFLLCLCLCGCAKEASAAVENESGRDLMVMKERLNPAVETYVPEQETNVVGRMTYYPNTDAETAAVAGTNCLTLFFENENVEAGVGAISLFEKDTQKKVASVDASDKEHVVVDTPCAESLDFTGFSTGTQVDICFEYAFQAGTWYYVLMDPSCFTLSRISSKAVTDAEMIVFYTKDYGFSGDVRAIYHPQQFLFFGIETGKSVSYAHMTCNPEEISLAKDTVRRGEEEEEEAYSGKALITFMKPGKPEVTVSFYDDQDEILDSVKVSFEVVPADVTIEEMEIVPDSEEADAPEEEDYSGEVLDDAMKKEEVTEGEEAGG